jgi:hypothetical protein
MKLPGLTNFLRLRHFLKAFDRLVAAQESQAHSLLRLANHVAGIEVSEPSPEDLQKLSGVSYVRDGEQRRIQDFEDQMFRRLGRAPTEDEIIAFLDGTSA